MDMTSGGNVSHLDPGIRQQVEADLDAFVAYWQSKRIGGDLPYRSDIDPRGIASLLPNAFIAERIAPGLARFRLAGTFLNDLMGMDVRGMPLSCLINTSSRENLADALVDLFDGPTIQRFTLKARDGFPRRTVSARMILLPLRSDLGETSRVLGCLAVTNGVATRQPVRFGIQTLEAETIVARNAPCPIDNRPILSDMPQENAPRHRSERSYLRLVT